uniref:Uncharacterized protein n=1 Tax=Anopheles aquasalis TaxID=42839 RepID=T1E953_ANOAQ
MNHSVGYYFIILSGLFFFSTITYFVLSTLSLPLTMILLFSRDFRVWLFFFFYSFEFLRHVRSVSVSLDHISAARGFYIIQHCKPSYTATSLL